MISCSCCWSWSKSSLGSLSSSDSSQFSLTESPVTVSVSSATGSSSSKWAKSSSLKRFLSRSTNLLRRSEDRRGSVSTFSWQLRSDSPWSDSSSTPCNQCCETRRRPSVRMKRCWSRRLHKNETLISSKNNKSHNENTEFGASFFSSTFEVSFFSAFWKEIRCKDRKCIENTPVCSFQFDLAPKSRPLIQTPLVLITLANSRRKDQSHRWLCCFQHSTFLAFSLILFAAFCSSTFDFQCVSDSSKHSGIGDQNDLDKN